MTLLHLFTLHAKEFSGRQNLVHLLLDELILLVAFLLVLAMTWGFLSASPAGRGVREHSR